MLNNQPLPDDPHPAQLARSLAIVILAYGGPELTLRIPQTTLEDVSGRLKGKELVQHRELTTGDVVIRLVPEGTP